MIAEDLPVRRSRVWLLRFLSVLAGLALVGAAELILRLVPGLGPPPLVTELARRGHQTLETIEPLYARRFFSARYHGALIASGRMAPTPFLESRGSRPRRIVFVGASTVQGFPHPRRLAAASFLQSMLDDACPGPGVQVFNLGITSIASYAVARVLDDAMALEPDLAIVYTGHNEYYGLYGAGSRTPLWRQALHYRLGMLRIAGLMDRAVAVVRHDSVSSLSLLEIMGSRGRVPLDSELRRRAAQGLRSNLNSMVEICRRNSVPLILCTLAANDSGFAPVATLDPGRSSLAARRRQLLQAVTRQERGSVAQELRAQADSLARALPEDALAHYIAGNAAAAVGAYSRAVKDFQRARDLDLMPWRAPEAHNRVIREVAASRAGVVLADVAQAFARSARGRGVGWALMSDHVHPSVHGQAVMARCLLEAVASACPGWRVDPGKARSEAVYRSRLGDLPVEQVGLDEAMAELLGSPPMDRYNTHNARRFHAAAAAGWRRLSVAEQRGALRWKKHRDQAPLVLDVADELFRDGDLETARRHYSAARREAPFTLRGDLWAAMQWGWTIRLTGRAFTPGEADTLRTALQRADYLVLAPDADRDFVSMLRGVLAHFLELHAEALRDLLRAFDQPRLRRQFAYEMFPALAEELVGAGRAAQARGLAREASAASGGNPYFIDLVNTLVDGGRLGPPSRAED